MRLNIYKADTSTGITADRDGVENNWRRQGFDINIAGLLINFEDEEDAAEMARAVLRRLGQFA